MCIYAAENRAKKQLILFIWLKLFFREGKFVSSLILKRWLAQVMEFKDTRPVDRLLRSLHQQRWLSMNTVTGYTIVSSFDKLRRMHQWDNRLGVLTYQEHLKHANGYIGAAIYSYLYRNYRRKEMKGRPVSTRSDTYTSIPPSSVFDHYKPIATTGVNALYKRISVSSASRLKIQAQKSGLLGVKKNYLALNHGQAELRIAKEVFGYVLKKNGRIYLQQIDTILPHLTLRRRRS